MPIGRVISGTGTITPIEFMISAKKPAYLKYPKRPMPIMIADIMPASLTGLVCCADANRPQI